MKKTLTRLLALLGVFLLLGGANVQAVTMYVVGENVDGASWNTTASQGKMTEVTSNIFVWDGNTLGSPFKLCNGTWDNNAYNRGNNGSNIFLGNSYKTNQNGGNININGGTVTKPRIIYNHTTGDLTLISTSGAEGWALRGDFYTKDNWQDIKLTKDASNSDIWTAEVTPTNTSVTFGVKKTAGTYEAEWYQGNVTISTTNPSVNLAFNYNDSNPKFSCKSGTKYKFTWNINTKILTVEDLSVTYPANMYILGHVNGKEWDPSDGIKMTKQSDGYTFKATADLGLKVGDAYFSFTESLSNNSSNWNGLGQRYGSIQDGTVPSYTSTNTIKTGENSFKVPAGNYDLTLDMKNMTLSIKQNSILKEDVITYAIHTNIIGNGTEWEDIELTEQNGKWISETIVTQDGELGVRKYTNGTQSDWFSAESDTEIVLGSPMKCKPNGSNFELAAGTYTFTFDPTGQTPTLTVTGTPAKKNYPALYLRGLDGWEAKDEWKFVSDDEGNYTLNNVTIEKDKEFKIADNTANFDIQFTFTDSSISPNTLYTLVEGADKGNMKMAENATNATVTFNYETKAFKVIESKAVEDASKVNTIYVVGNGDIGWNPGKKPISKNEDGNYVFTAKGVSEFQISTSDSEDWNTFKASALAVTSNYNSGVSAENGQTISIAPSTGNTMLPWEGDYTITVYGDLKTMTAKTTTPNPNVKEVYLKIVDGSGKEITKYPFTQVNEGDYNMYFLSQELTANEYGGLNFYIVYNGQQNGINDKSDSKDVVKVGDEKGLDYKGSNSLWLSFEGTQTLDFTYYNEYDGAPRIEVKAIEKPIEMPEAMYLYGHVNDLYWDVENYYKLNKKVGETGVYRADYVDIRGTWNDEDISRIDSRQKYDSTGDENFVAFFDHRVTDFTGTKYGSISSSGNVLVNPGYEKEQTEASRIKPSADANNFAVAEGLYWVEIDLNNMTATFGRYAKDYTVPVEMVWFEGGTLQSSKGAKLTQSQDEHIFTNPNEKNILQIAVGENSDDEEISHNPEHRVARQVVYTVEYKAPVSEIALMDATDGFSSEAAEGKYELIGNEGYYSNHLIELTAVGTYRITATVADSATGLAAYNVQNEDNSTTIIAKVLNGVTLNMTGQDDDEITFNQPFSVNGTNIFEGLFSFTRGDGNSGAAALLSEGIDFTVTIAPKDNAEGWVSGTDDDYEEALAVDRSEGGLYNQYLRVKGMNPNAIDGFYNSDKFSYKPVDNEDGSFNVELEAPCSGVYVMTIAPVENGSYDFTPATRNLYIYPNLTDKNKEGGKEDSNRFFIHDITFAGDNQINIPTTVINGFAGQIIPAYIPGTYFVDVFEQASQSERSNVKAKVVVDKADNYDANLDLSAIKEYGANSSLYINVSKNGAAHQYQFSVTHNNSDVATGVEAIGAEDGEAVYYNLQGVRVVNPADGIYIKVAGGKSEKVVIRK